MRRVPTRFYLSWALTHLLLAQVFFFVFTIGGNKFINQWKVSSDYITTEMVETGSSVKQPRNMESEKGTAEAASNVKKNYWVLNKNGQKYNISLL